MTEREPNAAAEGLNEESKIDLPPAGPHDKPELTDNEKTPGAGSLPDQEGGEVDGGSRSEEHTS